MKNENGYAMFERFKELMINPPIVRGTRIIPQYREKALKESYLKRIAELENEVKTLKEGIDGGEETTREEHRLEPDLPPELYIIDPFSHLGVLCYTSEYDQDGCKNAIELGIAFESEIEAFQLLGWLNARKILYDDTKGFTPDWLNPYEKKWYVWSDSRGNLAKCWSKETICNPGPYFATAEDVDVSIKAHEKEWLIYLLGR